MSQREDDLPIDWEGLTYAAGGSARGVLDQSQSGVALGVLADIECILAQERLERLASDIQKLLDADPEFTAEETKAGASSDGVVQLLDKGSPVRGVQGGDNRGCDRGACGVREVWPDPEDGDIRPRLQGALFFECVFSAPRLCIHLLSIKSNM